MKKFIFGVFLSQALTAAALAEPISIVVSANSKIQSIEEEDVARLYLGRSSNINGIDVTPIDFKDEVSLAQEFRQKVLKKNPLQYKQYWARVLFTGKGKPPTANIENPEGMLATIGKNDSMMGYTNQTNLPKDIKIVLVIK